MREYDAPNILVKFRLDGNRKCQVVELTYEQYDNLKKLPIIIECQIVENQKLTLNQRDMIALNKQLKKIFSRDKSHTKKLSE